MNDQVKKSKDLSAEQSKKLDGLKTTSDKIRYLNTLGYSRMEIATKLGKRYQHVRNVLVEDIRLGKKF